MEQQSCVSTPICLGGREYRAPKTVGGRIRSADETLRLIQPYLGVAGITRLANVTGLDRLGVPVVLAIRPTGQTLSTNAGKGLQVPGARVSAAMEGIEVFHAETVAPILRRAPWRTIESQHAVLEPGRLPLKANCHLNPDWAHDWLFGWDLIGQQQVAVPFGIVSLAYSGACYDFRIFQSSSNGVASGNHLLEAVLAGLLEVIERDAVTWHALVHGANAAPVIAWETSPTGALGELLGLLEQKGVSVFLHDYSNDLGIPVVKAFIADDQFPELGIYHGHAAALSTYDACLKALLEAVQSRAVYIAGSRDDMPREVFSRRRDRRSVRALAAQLAAAPKQPLIHRDLTTNTLEGDIAVLLQVLRRNNIHQVVVIDLTQSGWPIHVVKVIVPGLEGYITPQYRAGSFLAERIRGAQCAA
ncbi:MAG TPA: YcaO-like family protein [Bryobacteraceae bacterium]|jgi:ribosomal protein S12 methylthiotransferase accessory factor|nr:YcaO-like family protein [Bryobacteraceae bacterium]